MGDQGIEAWFLGVDLGTGSCKTVVVDQTGRVIAFGAADYPSRSIQEKWQEQDPEAILEGMLESVRIALKEAGELPGECAGMSIGGALHSLLALDQDGKPLTGVMTWADGRAVQEAETVRARPQGKRLYEQTGCPPHGMYPLYKILWLRVNRPEIFNGAANFLSAKEYVILRLTGRYWVDYALAAGSGLLDIHNLQWNAESLELSGIQATQLSQLDSPEAVHHGLDPFLAQKMGIPASTPLILGSCDAANANLGAGAVHSFQATCTIGTSGALRIFSPRPLLDAKTRSWCYAVGPERWLVGGAINNGGIALAWLRDSLNQVSRSQTFSFEDILDLAGQCEPGAGGLICLPFFAGERSPNWNLNARAAFFGLTLSHDFRHLARALLEAVAYRMRSIQEVLLEIDGGIRQIHASGGFTQSALWMQIVASVLKQELQVPAWGETSSLGASFWAMLGTGRLHRLEDAAQLVRLGDPVLPLQEQTPRYDHLYSLYTEIYASMGENFNRIAAVQSI